MATKGRRLETEDDLFQTRQFSSSRKLLLKIEDVFLKASVIQIVIVLVKHIKTKAALV